MKLPTLKPSMLALANLLLLGPAFFNGATAQCFPDCPNFQDGWGDFGLDTNPPEPGYLYGYVIFAYPNGACDYINSEDVPLNPPYPFNGLLNKNQPNCPPVWNHDIPFLDNFNDSSGIIGSCNAFTCVFPHGICTWNDRGQVIYADPSSQCPSLVGCDQTHTC
ncbi:hypothetical protein D9757_001109 [Collybiopsis confluens]|uniref:Uncharacterized protein n=1 Tax=Collybiopsis confluens TaxID=2823264 RepID=A0A8H5I103_9AGAR|nr:hypothetical protein D9757_001109 [Collybiopsis confluens]